MALPPAGTLTRNSSASGVCLLGLLDEAFRVELSNAGDSARTVTVREHPNRWQQWTLVSSSSKPSGQSPDTLEFRVEVPARGKATLTYAVRYQWGADQQPQ